MKSRFKLMIGDNIESLKKIPDNSIDSVVSDPPYGLSFMQKRWDYDVPSVEFWEQVYRVLKPGGHVLSFGGTRTYHRMVVNIEDAGFEIRDQIMWLYGSGFPKSHNIGKAVDKLQGNEREVVGSETKAKPTFHSQNVGGKITEIDNIELTKGQSKYEGWGTALKPANEPICVARKPLSEKSVALNVLKWGTGGINIDGCRVGIDGGTMKVDVNKDSNTMFEGGRHNSGKVQELNEGRFPANIILECICDEVIKGEKGEIKKSSDSRENCELSHEWGYKDIVRTNFTDKGDIHTNPNCPCRLLDEQSGERKVGKGSRSGGFQKNYIDGEVVNRVVNEGYNDKGGASRFFYNAKVSKKERNMGLDGFEDKNRPGQSDTGLYSSSPYCIDCGKTVNGTNNHNDCKEGLEYKPSSMITKNNHPTIKPVSLMTYLCRLVTPENGIVLDPFMGSGSTGIAALLEGFRFVGMEMDPEYMKIAQARIENYEKYREFIKK